MRNTDLHNHSYYSDGQISPKQLIRLAKKRGIKNISLTDHDSIGGVEEAIKEGKRIGVNVIPGIEIRADKGEVLGYFIDIKNKKLLRKIKLSNQRVEERVKDWCKKINNFGYKISFQEILKRFPKARGHVNEFYPLYLLYLKKYGKPLEISKTLRENNVQGKKTKQIPILTAIKLIKESGGVPVLAHPWLGDDLLKLKNIKKYVQAGLKGIEINNGDDFKFMREISKNKNILSCIKRIAHKYDLIITSGSDFHGQKLAKLMPGNHNLGKNSCDEVVVKQLRKFSKNF